MRCLAVWAVALGACSTAAAPAPHIARAPTRAATPPAPAFAQFAETPPFRLPHSFEPVRYTLRIALGDTRFTGHVEITGDVRDELPLLWLHGVDLVVRHATATREHETVALAFSAPREDQVLGFRPATPLAPGRWTIAIDYDGPIREREIPDPNKSYGHIGQPVAIGMFRRVVDGATYVFTQGEAIYARMIVPCIDEPDRKVPWQLTLDVPTGDVAASNTPIASETPIDAAHRRVEFVPTAPLPSYLLAFAVGPFDVIDAAPAASGVPIRVLALRGHKPAVAQAASVAPRILDALEGWLSTPYRYGKLDLVEVPHAGWGAMENPGLVTFAQSALEHDPDSIIAHELAHQWFGNLVTLAWWNDIWLNESFASFLEAKVTDELLPKVPFDAVTARLAGVQRAFHFSPSIQPASNADLTFERFAPFDVIANGASILRLLEVHLGEAPLRDALHAYLAAHTDGSVTTHDLAAALPADPTTTELLDGTIPTVDPTLHCDGHPRLHLDTFHAQVRICVAYDRDGKRAETCSTVDNDHQDVALPARHCPRWVMPDAGGLGIYYIAWSGEMVRNVIERGWSQLTATEKRTLFGERLDDDDRLAMLTQSLREDSLDSLPEVGTFITDLVRYVPPDLRTAFDAWAAQRYGRRVHATDLSPGHRHTRDELLALRILLRAHDPQLVATARALVADYKAWPWDYDLASDVLTAAAQASDDDRRVFLDTITAEDSRSYQLLAALGEVEGLVDTLAKDPARLAKLRESDLYTLVRSVCDAKGREALAKLLDDADTKNAPRLLEQVDYCILTRKRLEPTLRAWLGASPRP